MGIPRLKIKWNTQASGAQWAMMGMTRLGSVRLDELSQKYKSSSLFGVGETSYLDEELAKRGTEREIEAAIASMGLVEKE